MRIFAEHDLDGSISAFITVEGPAGTVAMITPSPGMFMAEIDGLKLDGLKIESGAPDVVERLRAIAQDHQVWSRCTLTKKGKAGKKGKG